MKSITLRPAKKMCRASAHLFAAALLVSSTVAYAYLPIHWNDKFAARDPECSDLIILGRVVQLERGPALTVEERDTYDIVTYGIYAELAVGRALKGEELIEKNRRVRLPPRLHVGAMRQRDTARLRDGTDQLGCGAERLSPGE